eukprot:CAMPEP_0116086820 /NCGR_PEP_ID=MMETSP0327-20121206/5052_1 /TAXON_ID=44447 /ORGANISM="Pseudo-nitzschia delicatissima, Strain B596" /LENGTH=462 /DNA_ID=CAMNT_0003577883 /DNA_START=83 /DNA_END=1471 /DNA_ORIENTATION=-
MAIKTFRACSACHAAKVKCVRDENSSKCRRCERLGLKCVEHVSRQGQGTRRRKKVKTKVHPGENTVEEALAISASLSSPVCTPAYQPEPTPFCPKSSGGVSLIDCSDQNRSIVCSSMTSHCNSGPPMMNRSRAVADDGLCAGMDKLEIEDTLLCKSITNGMGKDHFGLNFLIREWVSLAFSRRSFDLLARASFIAAKMKIPMDDIISNQSPFAAETDSEPMEFLARDLLLPKSERQTLGYPIDLQEVPWDLLRAVHIDPARPSESVQNRWVAMRWTCQGIGRFWTSPLFARDFASEKEMNDTFAANSNKKEVIDLFVPQSEKSKFSQGMFNLLFVNHKPNMEPFAIKNEFMVIKRNAPMPIKVDVVQSMKVIDLDSMIMYFEIQFQDRKIEHLIGDKVPNNKRDHVDVDVYMGDNANNDPVTSENIEFADIEITDEMEEFLKLIGGGEGSDNPLEEDTSFLS